LTYPAFVASVYGDDPELSDSPFEVQRDVLLEHSGVYSDAFSRAMRRLGNEAEELIYDVEPMQRAWAREHGVAHRDDHHWQQDILLHQIEHLRPDVLYLQDIHSLPHAVRQGLKDRFRFLRLVVVFKGFPGAESELHDVDLLLAGLPEIARRYASAGLDPVLMYHGFNTDVLERLEREARPDDAVYDFTFTGSSGFKFGMSHQSRYWTLVELLERTCLEVWVDEGLEGVDDYARTPAARLKLLVWRGLRGLLWHLGDRNLARLEQRQGLPQTLRNLVAQTLEHRQRAAERGDPRFPKQPLGARFPDRCHPPLFGLDMYQLMYQSRLTFNIHADASGRVGNMRMFEATGAGTCLVTDTGPNLADLFVDGKEVVTYSSLDECVEKVTYLLEHEDERQAIASAGQQRCLRDHSIASRCEQIDALIRERLRR
jgi:glycosyltransferase involved in cell wall biosynthesis